MRKLSASILLCCLLLHSASVISQEKTWSVYGDLGIGFNGLASLEGLQIPPEEMSFFKSRGITPNLYTESSTKVVPAFTLGASYYFHNFLRASLEAGSQYVNQSNYHARNFTLDALLGYTTLKDPHELTVDIGLGYYALRNTIIYSWRGLNDDGTQVIKDGIPEQKTVYLGNHDVNTLSIPVKLSYLYHIAGHSWVGAYAMGRYNCAPQNYCPKFTASVGIEYRYIFGTARKRNTRSKRWTQVFNIVNNYEFIHNSTMNIGGADSASLVRNAPVVALKVEGESAEIQSVVRDSVVLYFELDSADVTQTSARKIQQHIDLTSVKKLDLAAYTCSRGSYEHNLELGKRRQIAVEEYLRAKGYKGEFIESYSSGDYPDPDWRIVVIRILE